MAAIEAAVVLFLLALRPGHAKPAVDPEYSVHAYYYLW
jgi:hypothetical protein